ncbi:MAG: hypothetical protein WC773_02870 [Patescibacteria group bacterium]|jgi:hypothetical protein
MKVVSLLWFVFFLVAGWDLVSSRWNDGRWLLLVLYVAGSAYCSITMAFIGTVDPKRVFTAFVWPKLWLNDRRKRRCSREA